MTNVFVNEREPVWLMQEVMINGHLGSNIQREYGCGERERALGGRERQGLLLMTMV